MPVPGVTVQLPVLSTSCCPEVRVAPNESVVVPCDHAGLLHGPYAVKIRSDIGAVAPANAVIDTVVPVTPVRVWVTGAESVQNASMTVSGISSRAIGGDERSRVTAIGSPRSSTVARRSPAPSHECVRTAVSPPNQRAPRVSMFV